VRIDNTSNALTTIFAVEVMALDANGFEAPSGCLQVHDTMPVDETLIAKYVQRSQYRRTAEPNRP
jgi:hypothetical protein